MPSGAAVCACVSEWLFSARFGFAGGGFVVLAMFVSTFLVRFLAIVGVVVVGVVVIFVIVGVFVVFPVFVVVILVLPILVVVFVPSFVGPVEVVVLGVVIGSVVRYDSTGVSLVRAAVILGLFPRCELIFGDLELQGDHVAPTVEVTVDSKPKVGNDAVGERGS